MEITTVADDLVVLHDDLQVTRHAGLEPDTDYTFNGVTARTLPRPSGALLCRFATVNDVHFGETEAGKIDDHTEGPIRRAKPGDDPYPEVMNRAAAAEIATIDPIAVVVKGDLSQDGADQEWAAFESCYRAPFGDRLHVVRGNHESYRYQSEYSGDSWIELPGIAVALLDTAIPGQTTGQITPAQIEWLDDMIASTITPVVVMGHHQQWVVGESQNRKDDYFGLHPDGSDSLDELAVRRQSIVAYTSGHTHRHRVRAMTQSKIPSIEVGCTKDFPGTWAEYRVFEGGLMQVVHRISSPAALSWSESCRGLYRDFGIDYEKYALGTLPERCFNIPWR